jgi:hypothetical protein
MFEKCFEPKFQREAVKLVGADQDNFYFTDKDSIVDPVFSPLALRDLHIHVADAHDNAIVSTPESDATLPPHRLVGHQIKPVNDSLPGRVEKYLSRRKTFVVKYWKDPSAKKASKVMDDISHEDLMAMLLYNNSADNSDVDDDQEVELIIPSRRVLEPPPMANEETTAEVDDRSEDDEDGDDDSNDNIQ